MIRSELHIDATPDEVFALLADGERQGAWVVGDEHLRPAGERGQPPTTTGTDRTRLLGLEGRVTAPRPVLRFELHPDDEGTTVVMQEAAAARGLAKVARPFVLARHADTLWRLRAQAANDSGRRLPLPRLGDTTARVFGVAAALRRKRALHPRGVTRRGTAQLAGRGKRLADHEHTEVMVRFSRGAGLPARLPDVNGIAIRFVDARGRSRHRDVLLASVGSGPLRHVLVPSVDFGAARFSSVLRYRLDGEPVVLTATVSPRGLTLDRLRSPDPVEITACAVSAGGAEPLAVLKLGEVIDGDKLHFDPVRGGDDLVPLGALNRLRDPAYAASQAVRTPDVERRAGDGRAADRSLGAGA